MSRAKRDEHDKVVDEGTTKEYRPSTIFHTLARHTSRREGWSLYIIIIEHIINRSYLSASVFLRKIVILLFLQSEKRLLLFTKKVMKNVKAR